MNIPFEFNKKSLANILVAALMMLLGITGYDLTFHSVEDNQQLGISSVTESQPLLAFELDKANYDKECTYEFVVIADAILEKEILLDRIDGVSCGCKYVDEDFYFGRPQKIKVKNYNGIESILNAIKIPEGWKVKKWTHSQVWYVSKTNCTEPILDQPKLKDEK